MNEIFKDFILLTFQHNIIPKTCIKKKDTALEKLPFRMYEWYWKSFSYLFK